MKRIYLFFLLLISSTFLLAQDDEADANLVYDDAVYVDYIKTVNLHAPGIVMGSPILQLGSGALTLSFDDLDGDAREYIYAVEHCNADWTPSNLTELEFMVGYNDERIEYTEFSINTLVNYTHYRLDFPNENIRFTKSGNYLLKVYDNEDDKFLVLTRRFMVVEPRFTLSSGLALPSSIVKKSRTHQELDFVVRHKGFTINNPRKEVKVVVMQNGRWDNAITDIAPQYIRKEHLTYEFLDKIVFLAGKEFRFVDIRSLQYDGAGVRGIEEYQDGYDVTLHMDRSRSDEEYYNRIDINGEFVIGNLENSQSSNVSFFDGESMDDRTAKVEFLRQELMENQESNNIRSDYANVLFSIKRNEPYYDKDVYVFGAMSDWQIKESFKMTHQPAVNAYVVDIPLKQGFYNYAYVTVPKKGDKIPNMSELEGDWFETENQYTILVYYRPFGGRYDQLMGTFNLNSLRQ